MSIAKRVIAENLMTVKDVHAGKLSALEFLIGQAVRLAKIEAGREMSAKINELHVDELERNISAMKCCGNCFHHITKPNPDECENCTRQTVHLVSKEPELSDRWKLIT